MQEAEIQGIDEIEMAKQKFTDFSKESIAVYVIQPLQSAKIFFDFRDLQDKFYYYEHFAIRIDSRDDPKKEFRVLTLPEYFSKANSQQSNKVKLTNKRELLEIRLFNYKKAPVEFRVQLELYHGLFLPFFKDLKGKVTIQFYSANRQKFGTDRTYAVLISED